MLNGTMIGISQKLNQVFDGYQIYIDEVEQGLKTPCFLIVNLTGSQAQEVGNLYNWAQAFDIHYFPEAKKRITREVNDVADTLKMDLEYITVDGNLVRGSDMRHEVIDGVLHFCVNYDIRVRKVVEPEEFMGIITINEEVKISDE